MKDYSVGRVMRLIKKKTCNTFFDIALKSIPSVTDLALQVQHGHAGGDGRAAVDVPVGSDRGRRRRGRPGRRRAVQAYQRRTGRIARAGDGRRSRRGGGPGLLVAAGRGARRHAGPI